MSNAKPPRSAESLPGTAHRGVQRWRGGVGEALADAVAEEVPVAMRYNGASFAVMMATPCDLEDFALGFSLSEGLIQRPEEMLHVEVQPRLEGIELLMTVAHGSAGAQLAESPARLLPGRSSCGICGTRELEDALRAPPSLDSDQRYPVAALQRALETLEQHQPMNARTGATHAAAWADAAGDIQLVREDVGRHNALDKLTGAMCRQSLPTTRGLLLISSRASYEMVSKAAQAGIGIVAALSAPTALAIDIAQSAGICLVGFARQNGYNVYTCPERLQG